MLPSSIKKNSVLVYLTFNEQEPYFTNPYLQGENSPSEDKEEFLLDVSSIPVSHTPPCSSCSNHVPENPFDSLLEPMPETPNEPPMPETPNEAQEKTESAIGNVRFGKGKVFTKRNMSIPEPMQVQ